MPFWTCFVYLYPNYMRGVSVIKNLAQKWTEHFNGFVTYKSSRFYWGCRRLSFMLLTLFGGGLIFCWFGVLFGFFCLFCSFVCVLVLFFFCNWHNTDFRSFVIPCCLFLCSRLPELVVVYLYLCCSLLLWKCWYFYLSSLHYTPLNHIEF